MAAPVLGFTLVIASEAPMTFQQIVVIAFLLAQGKEATPPAASVDYAFFKERVQPIFLKKRPGHARCVACHTHRSPPLQPLSSGATEWTEEQSRKNFAVWKQFIVPGNPMKSLFLMHPLAASAGGDRFHAGGKHWTSQSDPEWQTLAAWVRGERLNGGSK